MALHSSTSNWCFSVSQPASCSPGESSWGYWYKGTTGEAGLTLERAVRSGTGWVQALCPALASLASAG